MVPQGAGAAHDGPRATSGPRREAATSREHLPGCPNQRRSRDELVGSRRWGPGYAPHDPIWFSSNGIALRSSSPGFSHGLLHRGLCGPGEAPKPFRAPASCLVK